MRIDAIESKPGRIWSIGISGVFGRRRFVRMLETIAGVRILQRPCLLSSLREDVFCRLEFRERRFSVEAVADSGYEISPEPRGCAAELLPIRAALLARDGARLGTTRSVCESSTNR